MYHVIERDLCLERRRALVKNLFSRPRGAHGPSCVDPRRRRRRTGRGDRISSSREIATSKRKTHEKTGFARPAQRSAARTTEPRHVCTHAACIFHTHSHLAPGPCSSVTRPVSSGPSERADAETSACALPEASREDKPCALAAAATACRLPPPAAACRRLPPPPTQRDMPHWPTAVP